MQAYVLTYHSHHVVGHDYTRNDHVALPIDLEIVTRAGCRIVSLDTLFSLVFDPSRDDNDDSQPLAAITFDDGRIYDVQDFVHPTFGLQRGFLELMREFQDKHGHATQPDLCATSFVIASVEARQVMESSCDVAYTYTAAGSMTDAWWNDAIQSGLLSIANHSWDHLHPALPAVAHSEQARADFTRVLSPADADAQIASAATFIAARTKGRNAPFFAYPFGHHNPFLAEEYLPQNAHRLGLKAAFTAEPGPVTRAANRWRLPRYVCGHHWESPEGLAAILAGHA